MRHAARLVALVTAIAVAGLSSALAVCVAGCAEPQAAETGHACHEDAMPATSIAADSGACSHAAPSLDRVDLARDGDTPNVVADNAWIALQTPSGPASARRARAWAASPKRPPASSPVLRI